MITPSNIRLFVLALAMTAAHWLSLCNSAADTINVSASTNAYVFRGSASSDQSETQTLVTKRLNDSNSRVAYVRFNLSSFLGTYSINGITSARLHLYMSSSPGSDSVVTYGLQDSNANGVSDSAWTGTMTWNNQPAKTASPNDIGGSASALPNANTTALLGSQSFGSTPGEVVVTLNVTGLQTLLLGDTNQQITLLFYNTGGNSPSWASISNTNGLLVPTLEIVADPPNGPPQTLTWSGAMNGNWDVTTANWKMGGQTGAIYKQGDYVTFDDARSGGSTVTVATQLKPASVTVNNSALSYTLSGSGSISGLTGLTKSGTGTLTVSTANDFVGSVTISGGTLKAGNAGALGAASGSTMIASGATLDVNAQNLTSEAVTVSGSGVSGNGAIVNTGGSQTSALRNVTLAGDTTFGGSGRWDIRNSGGSASLSTQGQPRKLTKVGTNSIGIVGATVDAALGDIAVQQGTLSVETSTTGLGDPTHTISVSSGATLQFYATAVVMQKNAVFLGGATLLNASGSNRFGGLVTLLGNTTFNVGGTSLLLSGGTAGAGGLTKTGSAELTINAAGHTGGTTLSSGRLNLSGSVGGTLTASSGTTLTGSFTNSGAATIGGALLPGGNDTAGTITTNGLTLNSGAIVTFDVNSSATVGGGVNDLLQVNGNLTLNNNALTINVLDTPQTNIPYRLVAYTGTRSGTFNATLNLDANLFEAHLDYSTPGQINLIFTRAGSFTIPGEYPTGPGPMAITMGADGKLVYEPESNGDIIPDFSSVGYRGSTVPIPNVAAVMTLSPVAGDNYPQIQNAINTVAGLPLDGNGFRGAIQLTAGIYGMSAGVIINKSGIVLRGAGDGPNGTILRRTVSGARIVSIEDSSAGRSEVSGTRKELTDTYVPLGAKWFRVENTTGLAVGDEIVIVRRSTTEWLAAINQTNWTAGSFNVQMQRIIVAIEGNRVMVDAPLIQSIDRANNYGGGYMYKAVWPGRTENVGVEDIRADCIVDVDTDNNTGGQFMDIEGAKNCWVRRCTNDRMKGHTMKIVSSAKWITVEDIVSFHNPQLADTSSANIQIHTFDSSAQGLLFHRITASHGGFEWSSGGMGSGPTVFSECTVPAAYAFSGPHMKWTVGVLYDSLWMNQSLNVLKNDGSHGFGGANHLAWNCETSGYEFDRPNTAHQWNVGCIGSVNSDEPRTGALPCERTSHGKHVEPGSLFRAQLAERIGAEQVLAVLGSPDGSNPFELTGSPRSAAPRQSTSIPVVMSVPPDYGGQTVTFSFSGLPAGVTGSLGSTTRTSGGTNSLNLTISSTAPAGSYPIRIKGSGTFPVRGGSTALITRTTTAILTITGSNNFSLAATPFASSVVRGDSTPCVIKVSGANGFSGNVSLSAAGLPSGVSAAFVPPTITGSGNSTLTLTASNSAITGTYTVTVIGSNAGQNSGATLQLTVTSTGALPDPWQDADVGSVALAGSATYGAGAFSISGGGSDIWGTADQFHFTYRGESGDFTITARVASQQNTDPWAKAGVMIRETAAANSKYAFVMVSPTSTHGVSMQYRSSTGGSAANAADVNGPTVPYWVRLVRSGNVFRGYRSSDGQTWTQVGADITITMAADVLAGLAVTSHNTAALGTATFDNVRVDYPDFLLAAAPASVSVDGGEAAAYTVTITGQNAFTGMVTLSATNLPDGTTAAFNPASIIGNGTSTLTLTTSNRTPDGAFDVTIRGTSTALSHESNVTMQVTPMDSDSDGVPDFWMLQYFGHSTGQAGDKSLANDDADGDHLSNQAEFLSGTDPKNSTSYLHVKSITLEGDNVRVKWSAVGGKRYVVEATTTLDGTGQFTEISPIIEAEGEGATETEFVDINGATEASRFYRIHLVP